MANPDGVIHGNSRCNLAGLDLNRHWMKSLIKSVTPETYHLRRLIWELHERVGIEYLFDFHGHSKK
jgi:murein tripeptide amidase MpaA